MRYTLAPDVAYVVADDFVPGDDAIYLMQVPDGAPIGLNGSGAFVLLAVLDGLDPVEAAAAASGLSADEVGPDVRVFVDDLVARRVLVPGEPELGGDL